MIPHPTRSSPHRCLQRHGLSRLPKEKVEKEKKKFKPYPIGYFHIDIAKLQTEEDRSYLFVSIDKTSKFAYAELHREATRATANVFLEHLIAGVPYTIHTFLTDKRKSAIYIAGNFSNRRRNFVGETFWARGFYVTADCKEAGALIDGLSAETLLADS